MLMNLYVFIIIATIVQINKCQDFDADMSLITPVRKSIFPIVRNASKRSNSRVDEVKFFEAISEGVTTSTLKPFFQRKRKNNVEVNFGEIKGLLSKLLDKIQDMEKDTNAKRDTNSVQLDAVSNALDSKRVGLTKRAKSLKRKKKKRKNEKDEKRQRWGKWTDWSPCSVSCGKGREIRWRHCLENCEVSETEMEEKTCQLPACGPSKLFGVIKL